MFAKIAFYEKSCAMWFKKRAWEEVPVFEPIGTAFLARMNERQK
jgi:hypothetical protein